MKTWKDQEVWSETKNDYWVKVNRTKSFEGLLTVLALKSPYASTHTILHQEVVSLTFNAIPHPVSEDIEQWQDIAAKYLDERSITVAPRQGG